VNTRRLAPVALAAAVLLGVTGCAMISPQATTIPYSPADGVNVPASGPLKVRNALFVADEAGENANFLAAIVNDTDKAQTLLVGVDGANKSVRVPARSTVSLGFDDAEPSKRYPNPRTVSSITGSDGFFSMRERMRLMCTSSVFVSPK
jgi:hypothetical protein